MNATTAHRIYQVIRTLVLLAAGTARALLAAAIVVEDMVIHGRGAAMAGLADRRARVAAARAVTAAADSDLAPGQVVALDEVRRSRSSHRELA